jgi:ABC-type nitrate/sulfonate/bicarbonate transport system substrate-binding protein
MGAVFTMLRKKEDVMWQAILTSLFCLVLGIDRAAAQPVRGAFPSPSIQILPLMVASERGFFKREGLDLELVFVRGASTAVQALLANQIHFIFSIGPQMPAVWEGNDIILLGSRLDVRLFLSSSLRIFKGSRI